MLPTEEHLTLVTDRDLDILAALDMAPLTAEQLMKLSRTFSHPFPDPRRVRERLRRLIEAERVRAFRYATSGPGAPVYYVLSPLGYRLLHGHAAPLPSRRTFEPIGIARQRHTHALADFMVHTVAAAHSAEIRLTGHRRENSLRLDAGGDSLYPDAAFQLLTLDGRLFRFFVEIDCSNERILSEKVADSWQRKIDFYEAYADDAPNRFRVLVVVVAGEERLRHVLDAAARRARNPRRGLFYGVTLDFYCRVSGAVTSSCWLDHRGNSVPLIIANRMSDDPVRHPLTAIRQSARE